MGIFITIADMAKTLIGGFFGYKGDQAKTLQDALQVIANTQTSDAQFASACATAMQAIQQYGTPFEKSWRPLLMYIIIFIVIDWWFFGYMPPHINDPLPEGFKTLLYFLEIGLCGYMPLRSIDKWIYTLQMGKLLQTYINQRLMRAEE